MVAVTHVGPDQVPTGRQCVKVMLTVFNTSLTSDDLKRADSASLWKW